MTYADFIAEKGQDEYLAFLARKAVAAPMRGMENAPTLASHLFGFQRACVEFALQAGSSGLFLDTGLGKTECQLEFAEQARNASNGRALILTPLAVAQQTCKRGHKYGYQTRVIRSQDEVGEGINICNYDRVEGLDPDSFGAVTFDEASIFKSFGGKTAAKMIQMFDRHRWRLPATATPAPNDHMELGQYADLLGIMAPNEMLSRWFINDASTASQQWRLKGHAVNDFWNWMASWSRMASMPSDLGFDDAGYELPPLQIIRHMAAESALSKNPDDLFGMTDLSATNVHAVKRQTSEARAKVIADLTGADRESWVIWCDTDYEADALKAAMPDAMEVRGSMSIERKEAGLAAFEDGSARRLITKPSVAGFGLDWSFCARTAFVGRSYSYETWYQAVRRFWRFGQKREVQVHLAVAEGEDHIGRVIDRKASDHRQMKAAMREAMKRAQGRSSQVKIPYNPAYEALIPQWLLTKA